MMETETPRPQRRWRFPLLLIAAGVLIAALFGGGGYYLGMRTAKLHAGGDGGGQRAEAPKSGLLKHLSDLGNGVASLGNAASSLTNPNVPQTGAGGAAGIPQNFEQQFKILDRDGDGKLSPQEVPNPQFFKHLDTNGDGSVSKDEAKVVFDQIVAQRRAEMRMTDEQRFKQLDRDGNGKLSPKELPVPADIFKRVDANGDGAVTLAELKVLESPQPPKPAATHQGGAAPSTPPPAQTPGDIEKYRALDKDGDGKLSAKEFPNAVFFKMLDTNGDGYVTEEEGNAFLNRQPPKGATEQPKQTAPTTPTEQPAPPTPTEDTAPAPPAQPDANAPAVEEDKQ